MTLINHNIPNLLNGISQQAPSVRLDNHLEEQVNMQADVGTGLTRRNPVKLIRIEDHDGTRDYSEEHKMFTYTQYGQQVSLGIKPNGIVYRFDKDNFGTVIEDNLSIQTYLRHNDPKDIVVTETENEVILVNRNKAVQIDQYSSSYQYNRGMTTRTSSVTYPDKNSGKEFMDVEDGFMLLKHNDDVALTSIIDVNGYRGLVPNALSWMQNNYLDNQAVIAFGAHYSFVPPEDVNLLNPLRIEMEVEPYFVNLMPQEYDAGNYQVTKTYTLGVAGVSTSTLDVTVTYGGVSVYTTTINGTDDTLESIVDPNKYYDATVSGRYYAAGDNVTGDVYQVRLGADDESVPIDRYTLHRIRVNVVDVDYTEKYFRLDSAKMRGTLYGNSFDIYDGTNYVEVTYYLDHPDVAGVSHDVTYAAFGVTGTTTGRIAGTDFAREYVESVGHKIKAVSLIEVITTGLPANATKIERYSVQGTYISTVVATPYQTMIRKNDQDTLINNYVDTNAQLTDKEITYGSETFVRGEKKSTYTGQFFTYDFYEYLKADDIHRSRGLFWVDEAVGAATYYVRVYEVIVDPITDEETTTLIHEASDVCTVTSGVAQNINDIMDGLVASFAGSSPKINGVTRRGNVGIITFTDRNKYRIVCEDSFGFNIIHGCAEATILNKDSIDDIAKLPSYVVDSASPSDTSLNEFPFILRVQPVTRDDSTAIYFEFDESAGTWKETTLPNSPRLNKLTMPIVISKSKDNVITLDNTKWNDMLVGDINSNPFPSFVDSKISDVILFNGRLGFSSGNSLVFSAIDDLFNFFRTTTSSVLVADRVDLELDSSRLGYTDIQSIFTMDGKLFVSTGRTQAALSINSNLDLTGSTFVQVSAHDTGSDEPIAVRKSMYFPVLRGDYGNILDFSADVATGTLYNGELITKHCEKYIKGEIMQMLYTDDLLFVRTTADRTKLYVQNSFVLNGQTAQNAWHEWRFSLPIKYIYTLGSTLNIVFEDIANNQTIHGTINLVPQTITEDTETQIGYFPYLDYYTTDHTLKPKLTGAISIDLATSEDVITPVDDTAVTGVPFESYVVLSEQVPRVNSEDGKVKLGFGKLMLRRFQGTLGYTGPLFVTTSKTGRPDSEYVHIPETPDYIGVNVEPVSDADLRFSANGRAEDISIKISTQDKVTPFNFLSLEYQGQLVVRGRRF